MNDRPTHLEPHESFDPADLCERSDKPHETLARETVFYFFHGTTVLLSLGMGPGGVLGTGEGAEPLPSGTIQTCCWEVQGGPVQSASFPTPFSVATLEQARHVVYLLKIASGLPWEARGETRAALANRVRQWAESEAAREKPSVLQ